MFDRLPKFLRRLTREAPPSARTIKSQAADLQLEQLEERQLLSAAFGFAAALGGEGVEDAFDLVTDDADNVYLVGAFTSPTIDLDPGPGVLPFGNSGGSDGFVIKLNAAGELLWAKTLGGPQDAQVLAVTWVENRLYLAGYFQGELIPENGVHLTSQAGQSAFLVCLGDQGDYQWSQRVAGEYTVDGAYAIDIHSTFNSYETSVYVVTTGLSSAIVSRFMLDGTFRWQQEVPATVTDSTPVRVLDSQTEILVSGSFRGTVDFDPGPGVQELTAQGTADGFVLAFGVQQGDLFSVHPLHGDQTVAITGITQYFGRTIVVGTFRGTFDAAAEPSLQNHLTSNGGTDAFWISAEIHGLGFTLRHAMGLGGSGDDHARGVARDELGTTRMIASLDGTVDLDPGPGEYWVTGDGMGGEFVTAYSLQGQFVSARQLASYVAGAAAQTAGMWIDSQANVYAAGRFFGEVDFDPSSATGSVVGIDDAFLLQFSAMTTVALPQNGQFDWITIRFTSDRYLELLDGQSQTIVERVWLPVLLGIRVCGAVNEGDALLINLPSYELDPRIPLGIRFDGGTGTGRNRVSIFGQAPHQVALSLTADRVATGVLNAPSNDNTALQFAHVDQIELERLSGAHLSTSLSAGTTLLQRLIDGSQREGLLWTSTDQSLATPTVSLFLVSGLDVLGGNIVVRRHALRADGLAYLALVGVEGEGRSISIYDDNLTLDGVGGLISVRSYYGQDVLTIRGDGDFNVRRTFGGAHREFRVLDQYGSRLFLDDLQRLRLVGGPSANSIDARNLYGAMPLSLIGGGGNDTLVGSTGEDYLDGGSGDDWLEGSLGPDSLHGGDGIDRLFGGDGDDFLDGGSNNDYLDGGQGNDALRGGEQHDILIGSSGFDDIVGGQGRDRIRFSGTNQADTISLRVVPADFAELTNVASNQSLLERDRFWLEPDDHVSIYALDGDDVVYVQFEIDSAGRVDGGLGDDTIIVPPSWEVVP